MAWLVDLGCLGTALLEELVGEMGSGMDDFEVILEPEFTWVFVKVKGLGLAGALREPMDSNSKKTHCLYCYWSATECGTL